MLLKWNKKYQISVELGFVCRHWSSIFQDYSDLVLKDFVGISEGVKNSTWASGLSWLLQRQ